MATFDERAKDWDTPEHIERVMRRAAAMDAGVSRVASMLFWFASAVAVEKVHPLQCGIVRLKSRRDRRPTLPIEPVWRFYPAFALEFVTKLARHGRLWFAIDRLRRSIRTDPNRHAYSDLALTPSDENDSENMQLLTHSKAAQAAVVHVRKVRDLTAAVRSPAI